MQHIESTNQSRSLPSAFFLSSSLVIANIYRNSSYSNSLFFPHFFTLTVNSFFRLFVQIPCISVSFLLLLLYQIYDFPSSVFIFLPPHSYNSVIYTRSFQFVCRLYIRQAAWGPSRKGRASCAHRVSPKHYEHGAANFSFCCNLTVAQLLTTSPCLWNTTLCCDIHNCPLQFLSETNKVRPQLFPEDSERNCLELLGVDGMMILK